MFGLAFDALSLCARVRTVLAAVLRPAVVALAAAGIAAAMVGRVLTRSALCTLKGGACGGVKASSDGIGCGWDGSSDGWAGADALSFCAHATVGLQRCLGMQRRRWLLPDGNIDDWVGV